jgi:hypothetical protein
MEIEDVSGLPPISVDDVDVGDVESEFSTPIQKKPKKITEKAATRKRKASGPPPVGIPAPKIPETPKIAEDSAPPAVKLEKNIFPPEFPDPGHFGVPPNESEQLGKNLQKTMQTREECQKIHEEFYEMVLFSLSSSSLLLPLLLPPLSLLLLSPFPLPSFLLPHSYPN